jgi:hypothetical protein
VGGACKGPPQGLVYVVLLILYAVGNNTFLHQLYIYHFPSKEHGKTSTLSKKSNLCLGCHQQKTQKEEIEKTKLCNFRRKKRLIEGNAKCRHLKK